MGIFCRLPEANDDVGNTSSPLAAARDELLSAQRQAADMFSDAESDLAESAARIAEMEALVGLFWTDVGLFWIDSGLCGLLLACFGLIWFFLDCF